ncbi:MAG: hypothetical protein LBD68_00850 [Zoogloeaceae bacterium]|jgi:hypothetical protein|nr:hypothetical protein [Zoogloeaceae bacterium]
MADNVLRTALEIKVDVKGENARKFTRDFEAQLKAMGKTNFEIGTISSLAERARNGELALERLSDECRDFIRQLDTGLAVGEARDFLGLAEHKEARAEIEKVSAAYDTRKNSGSLTGEELAQASLRAREQIMQLEGQHQKPAKTRPDGKPNTTPQRAADTSAVVRKQHLPEINAQPFIAQKRFIYLTALH